MNKKRWWKSKTIITGVVSIIGAAAGFATGALPMLGAIQIIEVALLGVFLRSAIDK